jgi:hypothetical protein
MPANIIQFDRNTEPMRQIVRGLQLLREGYETLQHARAVEVQMCDGTTDVAAHWDLLAGAGSFAAGDYADANAAAMASFAEIDSLYSVLTSQALAAIQQACAKHGV